MESADEEVLRAATAWRRDGHAVTLITIARAWGSAPRSPGSLAVVRQDGRLAGSVSGGCIEEDLIRQLCSRRYVHLLPDVVTYGVTAEETSRFGLPCGGRLELVLENLRDPDSLIPVLEALARREPTMRRVDLASGEVSLVPARREQDFYYDRRILEKLFGPVWRLLLIGAGQLSQYVARMALALDYEVIACDPREEVRATWDVPNTVLDERMPDDAARALADDPRSALVTLTHDPRIDDMALMEALDSRAFYVGALGSRLTNARRRERLMELDVSPQGLARLHGPVGLPIGSRTAAEIAVAVLAELTAVRRGAALDRIQALPPAPSFETVSETLPESMSTP